MTEQPPITAFPASARRDPARVYFDRTELNRILAIYGRMVAAGEWKDYAIDMAPEEAVFSIFRRASEMPIYQVIKSPRDARRQGAYRIVTMNGQVIKRGHDLAQALKFFERKLLKVVED